MIYSLFLTLVKTTSDSFLHGFEIPFPNTSWRKHQLPPNSFYIQTNPPVAIFVCGYIMAFPAGSVVFEFFVLVFLLRINICIIKFISTSFPQINFPTCHVDGSEIKKKEKEALQKASVQSSWFSSGTLTWLLIDFYCFLLTRMIYFRKSYLLILLNMHPFSLDCCLK